MVKERLIYMLSSALEIPIRWIMTIDGSKVQMDHFDPLSRDRIPPSSVLLMVSRLCRNKIVKRLYLLLWGSFSKPSYIKQQN
ncbi:hypothetical protein VTN00DRAFT_7061 [Thermoascus crustaceus]|uniref:uncharacterized protein n=1 Tax=Thermoascus crustaceus TaxID=5088 RepID=UPI003742447A